MPNLDYPISLLVAKGKEIAVAPVYDTLGMKEKSDKLYAVNKAIDILRKEKHEYEKMKNRKKLLEKYKKIKGEINGTKKRNRRTTRP